MFKKISKICLTLVLLIGISFGLTACGDTIETLSLDQANEIFATEGLFDNWDFYEISFEVSSEEGSFKIMSKTNAEGTISYFVVSGTDAASGESESMEAYMSGELAYTYDGEEATQIAASNISDISDMFEMTQEDPSDITNLLKDDSFISAKKTTSSNGSYIVELVLGEPTDEDTDETTTVEAYRIKFNFNSNGEIIKVTGTSTGSGIMEGSTMTFLMAKLTSVPTPAWLPASE